MIMFGEEPVLVQPDPITSFLWGYSEYIIVGFGVFMILVFIRYVVIPWLNGKTLDELKVIDRSIEDGREDEE